jgi:hypothetical protein
MLMHGPGALIEIMIRQFEPRLPVYRCSFTKCFGSILGGENTNFEHCLEFFTDFSSQHFFHVEVLQIPTNLLPQIPPDNSKISSLERRKSFNSLQLDKYFRLKAILESATERQPQLNWNSRSLIYKCMLPSDHGER